MRIELNREILSKKLITAISVINENHPLPVLSNALFELKEGRMFIHASDQEITVKTSMEFDLIEGEELDFVIDPGLLAKTIQTLNADVIWLNYSPADKQVTFGVKSQKKIFTIPADNSANDFPLLRKVEYNEEISVHGSSFAKAITDCAKFTSKNDLRVAFRGVNIFAREGKLKMYGTETQVIAFYEFTCEGDFSETILPRNLAKIVAEFKDAVSVSIKKDAKTSSVLITDGVIEVSLTTIDAKMPDFEKIFSQVNLEITTVIPRAEFLNAVKRGSYFQNNTSQSIIFDFSLPDNMLEIKAENLDFKKSSSEEIQCESKDSFFGYRTGFNSKFISPIITSLEGDNIIFSQAGFKSTAMFRDDKEKSYKCMFAVGPIILNQ
jgi:DNA polymerase-3 subunit beta